MGTHDAWEPPVVIQSITSTVKWSQGLMPSAISKLLSRITLGVILLAGTTIAPCLAVTGSAAFGGRISEHHSDSSGGSNNSNCELVENHGYLNRRFESSRREMYQSPIGGFQKASLIHCPRDPRLRRTLLTLSGHVISGHRWANGLMAPLLT